MTTVAYLAVAPEGRTDDGCIWLRPAAVPGLRKLVDTIHDEGALVAGQIGHAGPVANAAKNGVPSLSPSRMSTRISMKVTRAITETEIERVTMDYARGAALMAEAGFDSIEIHLAHNYLLSSFLSPKFNRRKDDWSGSLENRARFARQVVATVRERRARPHGRHRQDQPRRRRARRLRRARERRRSPACSQADGHLDAIEMTGGSSLANPIYLFRGDAPLEDFAKAMPLLGKIGFKLAGKKFMPSYPFEEAYFRRQGARWSARPSTCR